MENIFVAGKNLEKKNIIGYQYYLNEIKRLLDSRNNVSITGLPRFGKTTLIKTALSDIRGSSQEKLLTVYIDLITAASFYDVLIEINGIILEQMEDLENGEEFYLSHVCQSSVEKLEQTQNGDEPGYRRAMKSFLKRLKKAGYEIILVLDEFDDAQTKFSDPSCFGFMRSLASDSEYCLNLVTVSRRRLYVIENQNPGNSTFDGIMKTVSIKGFNDEDLNELYFKLGKYGVTLTRKQKDRLFYYCGRCPYLNAMFAHELAEAGKGSADIDSIYGRCRIDVDDYYKRTVNLMKSDSVMLPGKTNENAAMDKIMAVLYGPKIGLKPIDVEILTDMGYLDSKANGFYSVSEFFMEKYVRGSASSNDTVNLVLSMEKCVKTMVRNVLSDKYSTDYLGYDLFEPIFSAMNISLSGCVDMAESTNVIFNSSTDLLDAMSLNYTFKIVWYHWDAFSSYFDNDDFKKWEPCFDFCVMVRNPLAHAHPEYLSEDEQNIAAGYCSRIMQTLRKNGAPLDAASLKKHRDTVRKEEVKKEYYSRWRSYQEPDPALVGEEVSWKAAERKPNSLSGFFKFDGKYYRCLVPKKLWLDKYQDGKLDQYLGKDYDVRITKVAGSEISVEFVN